MRQIFSLLFLVVFLLTSCAQRTPEPLPTPVSPPTSAMPPATPTLANAPDITTASAQPPTLTPGLLPPTPTAESGYPVQPGSALPLEKSLVAIQVGDGQDKALLLADPAQGIAYEFDFPDGAYFAMPFLASLSPDTRYFVYFTGGWLETLYDHEYLRVDGPDLQLHILDLRSGETVFSIPLLSPRFPQDLAQIADTIKDDWTFTSSSYTFEDVVAATQEFMLDHIRSVAWSPDSSLLAFASQNPGPSSDLYFFSPASNTAWQVTTEPGHILQTAWAPDSSALIMVTSLYDRHAREDTTYLLTREGSLLTSFTSQVWFFSHWHDATYAILYAGTDAGDLAELKTVSSADGTINMLWEGTYADIAFSPDLTTFLSSSNIPTAPYPPHKGLFLGRFDDPALITLSEDWGWGVEYWGSERFAFAASSSEGGTLGIASDGTVVQIDDGKWKMAASPDGNYLVGFYNYHPSYSPEIVPGLRIFDDTGLLLTSADNINVTCVGWNATSSALVYQVENSLYLWDVASGATHMISDQLNQEECAFMWVHDTP